MHRPLIDRCTDTTAFRVARLLSGIIVLPVLGLGVLTTIVGGAGMLLARPEVHLEHAVFALLSLGGALGIGGYFRTRRGAKHPGGHNVVLTLVCLCAGIAAALAVAGLVMLVVVEAWLSPWGADAALLLGVGFAAANVVWAISGVAWMQRLMRRYGEQTGQAYDGLPVVFLVIGSALATLALLVTAAL